MDPIQNILHLVDDFLREYECIDKNIYLGDLPSSELIALNLQFSQALNNRPNDEQLRAKSWATLCELIYRTTNFFPKYQDISLVLAAEIENAETSHAIYRFPQKKFEVNAGNPSNDQSVGLAMLRCANQLDKTIDIVDFSLSNIHGETICDAFYNRILIKIQPSLDCLGVDINDIRSKVRWYTPGDPSAKLDIQSRRVKEDFHDDTDSEDNTPQL